MKVAIVDGYTDEPSRFGVPPYIAPLPRYILGAVLDAGHEATYHTIDQVRGWGKQTRKGRTKVRDQRPDWKLSRISDYDILIIIAGAVVPGRYIGGRPISPREAAEIAERFDGYKVLAGACATFGFPAGKGDPSSAFDAVAGLDADAGMYDLLSSGSWTDRRRELDELDRWSVLGAGIVEQHPYPTELAMLELDGSWGCLRYDSGGCSFCYEVRHGEPRFRPAGSVEAEVRALRGAGAVNFRLGGMADIFSYHADETVRGWRPSPQQVTELLTAVRIGAPDLRVLHTDNADPGMIAAWPKESRSILDSIVELCTPGNVLSLGMESADPNVIDENNLNAFPGEVMTAVEMINEIGGGRGSNGLPNLLPGLNLVLGLPGETKETMQLNEEFLDNVVARGLVLRRINVRKVYRGGRGVDKVKDHGSWRFRSDVMERIDREMINRAVPAGTVLRDLVVEAVKGGGSLARQIGTYPVMVHIPKVMDLHSVTDAVIVGHGRRSLTGIVHPACINTITGKELETLPGIGGKRATRLLRERPFKTWSEVEAVVEDIDVARRLRDLLMLE